MFNALEFAKELVEDWLVKYKFANWDKTQTKKIPVTEEMKRARAKEIAATLTNRGKWRSHGRSIKLCDLVDDIGLRINRIEDDKKLAEIVFRIQNVCKFLFDSTSAYKIFATADNKIFRTAAKSTPDTPPPTAEIEHRCAKCGKTTRLYAKFVPNPQIDIDFKKKGCLPFPNNDKFRCACGMEVDLSGLKKRMEFDAKAKIIHEGEA